VKVVSGKTCYDSISEIVHPDHTAMLVVDAQNDFCHPDGHFARHGKDITLIQNMLPALVDLVVQAQALGVLVVWIQQTTLPYGRSDSPAWLYFKTRDGKSPEYTLDGSWGQQFVEGLMPGAGEPIVKKHRSSAFIHTELDRILRVNGIETVVVGGVVTQGCVESTLRDASFYDYYTVLVEDCVATTSQPLHEASMLVMKSRHDALTARELTGLWKTLSE
jgi:ureidoacrylate peracid hydrolase